MFLKHFRFQAGDVAHGLRDVGKRFQWQMTAVAVEHRPGSGINLYQGNVRSRGLQFPEALGILLDFCGQRFFPIDGREQALDDYRALAGHQ